MMTETNIVPASYKDPAGFVFTHNQQVYRQVNIIYSAHYDQLLQSGLYSTLTGKNLLITHQEDDNIVSTPKTHYKTLLPSQLSFISYPYEWSFDMLKDAALLTLEINIIALQHGMILKDATALNIQFHKGKPLFIDTLSFEKYDEAKPWIAYTQFCSQFLFPLLLNHYCCFEAQQMLSVYPNGLSATFTSAALPFRTRLNLGIGLHVHLQSRVSRKKQAEEPKTSFTKQKTERLLLHLQSMITSLRYKNKKTTWNNYYEETILSEHYLREKEIVFTELINSLPINTATDIGANDGYFSNILSQRQIQVLSTDFDGACINRLYLNNKSTGNKNILSLIIDISNPSPASGLMGEERLSFAERSKSDLLLALAVIHHLHFTNNIPLKKMADMFVQLARRYLIIEFVPQSDEKVKIIKNRKNQEDDNYSESNFEECFSLNFIILKKKLLKTTDRILYLMEIK